MINRPKWNGAEWVWKCPNDFHPDTLNGKWATSDETFVGAIKKGRRHLLVAHWIVHEFRKGKLK